MTDTKVKPKPPKRVKDTPTEIFGGEFVNRGRLREILGNCSSERITRLIGQGMPYTQIGPRQWFNVERCLEFFKDRQVQKNLGRLKRDNK